MAADIPVFCVSQKGSGAGLEEMHIGVAVILLVGLIDSNRRSRNLENQGTVHELIEKEKQTPRAGVLFKTKEI